MPDEQLLTLAKTGDLNALKQILNQTLGPKSVHVHDIGVRKDCLQVSIESESIPDQSTLVPLLQHTLEKLQVDAIHTLEVYGHTVGDELPHWMQQINPLESPVDTGPPLSHTPSAVPTQQSSPATRDQTVGESPNEYLSAPQEKAEKTVIEYAPAIAQVIQAYTAGSRDFQKSNFNEMDLQGINLTLADLQESQLVWANLSEASLGHANLTSAQLRHANLSNANLQGANLQGADLQGANLKGANLSWAKLRGVNFTGADLTDANLVNANLERVTMPDGTYLD